MKHQLPALLARSGSGGDLETTWNGTYLRIMECQELKNRNKEHIARVPQYPSSEFAGPHLDIITFITALYTFTVSAPPLQPDSTSCYAVHSFEY